MPAPTLVILAAGLGSRFGGLKQLAELGPGGAALMDYSVHDARGSGFDRVVFVVRPEMAEWAEQRRTRSGGLPAEVVFQRLDDIPAGFEALQARQKPWGTVHAVLAVRQVVHGPFAVLNADDFYGRPAFTAAGAFLAGLEPAGSNHGVIGYRLDETLSEAGGVTRALLEPKPDGTLAAITELRNLRRDYGGMVRGERQGMPILVPGEALVSMNFWLFGPAILGTLERAFEAFLRGNPGAEEECFLPEAMQGAVSAGMASVHVLNPGSRWCGVTYPDDAAVVRSHLSALTARGAYPAQL